MGLPKITQTKTSVTLPSGKKIRIRPFVGSEEKALLMSKQSTQKGDRINAAMDVLSSCSDYDVSKFPMTDFEFLFMKAYEISVSQTIDIGLRCRAKDCEEVLSASIPLDQIEVPKLEKKRCKIDVGLDENGDPVKLFIRIPTVGEALKVQDDENADVRLIFECLEGVYVKDEKAEIDDFAEFEDWFMSQQDLYRKCTVFLNSIPRIEFVRDWECPSCKHQNHTVMRGFDSFFS